MQINPSYLHRRSEAIFVTSRNRQSDKSRFDLLSQAPFPILHSLFTLVTFRANKECNTIDACEECAFSFTVSCPSLWREWQFARAKNTFAFKFATALTHFEL